MGVEGEDPDLSRVGIAGAKWERRKDYPRFGLEMGEETPSLGRQTSSFVFQICSKLY